MDIIHMKMQKLLMLFGVFGCLATLNSATAQPPPPPRPEFLRIESARPVDVFLKPSTVRGADGSGQFANSTWFGPYRIDTGKSQGIRLPGYQPFDITIRDADGIDTVMKNVELCTWMSECRTKGKYNWEKVATAWRWMESDGKREYLELPGSRSVQQAFAKQDDVTIYLSPFEHYAGADSTIKCSFVVVDGASDASDPIEGATLVFLAMNNMRLVDQDQVTNSKGQASAQIPVDTQYFRVRVYKNREIKSHTFTVGVKQSQTLPVSRLRQ